MLPIAAANQHACFSFSVANYSQKLHKKHSVRAVVHGIRRFHWALYHQSAERMSLSYPTCALITPPISEACQAIYQLQLVETLLTTGADDAALLSPLGYAKFCWNLYFSCQCRHRHYLKKLFVSISGFQNRIVGGQYSIVGIPDPLTWNTLTTSISVIIDWQCNGCWPKLDRPVVFIMLITVFVFFLYISHICKL